MVADPQRGDRVRRLAASLLMPAAAVAVHQLRYWLAFGGHAGAALQAQGHSYLHSVVPWIVLLLGVAVGVYVRTLGRALGGDCSVSRYTFSFVALWLLCAACLVAIYASQELLEGWFASGHPVGVAGIFGYGGWYSIPAAVAVGLVLAAIFHGARWVLGEVARRRRGRPTTRLLPPAVSWSRPAVFPPRLAPLADGWSGRGPPRRVGWRRVSPSGGARRPSPVVAFGKSFRRGLIHPVACGALPL
jgi:hypothetical protein